MMDSTEPDMDRTLISPANWYLFPFEGPLPRHASSECRVLRQVYKETPHRAVVHVHPPHAVTLSKNVISPVDSEGLLFCPCIPILTGFPGSDELALNISQRLLVSSVAIARGHGAFAGGKDLDEAYIHTTLVEHSCRILILLNQINL